MRASTPLKKMRNGWRDWAGRLPVQLDLIDVNDATGRFMPPDDTDVTLFVTRCGGILAAPVVRPTAAARTLSCLRMLAARGIEFRG
jgi:hypothetical protein